MAERSRKPWLIEADADVELLQVSELLSALVRRGFANVSCLVASPAGVSRVALPIPVDTCCFAFTEDGDRYSFSSSENLSFIFLVLEHERRLLLEIDSSGAEPSEIPSLPPGVSHGWSRRYNFGHPKPVVEKIPITIEDVIRLAVESDSFASLRVDLRVSFGDFASTLARLKAALPLRVFVEIPSPAASTGE